MPTETLTGDGRAAPEHVATIAGVDEAEIALREAAVQQVRRRRTFRVHLVVLTLVMLGVGAAWALTEYYTAHTAQAWPSSFADAPADRPGVWSTWYFYFVGVCVVVLAIDAYRTYAKPYMERRATTEEIDREVDRLRPR